MNMKNEQRFRPIGRGAATLACLALLAACGGHTSRMIHQTPESCTPKHSVHVNGIDIEYESFGDEKAPPLLLIMGLSAQMVVWDEELIEQLVQRGFRVIRFDNRDVGLSTHLDSAGVPSKLQFVLWRAFGWQPKVAYRLSDMAADAVGLLDALKIPAAHVVGASMGGMIAQELAIRYPERVLTLTSVMSTTGDTNLPSAKPEIASSLSMSPVRTREEAIERSVKMFQVIGSPGFPFDAERVQRLAALSYDRCYDPDGVTRQIVAIFASGSRKQALAAVKVPTLVIHGKEDPLVPVEGGIDTAQSIPGAELLLIDGMGHDLPREMLPRFIEAISTHAHRVTPLSAR
ncbi:alpha/beta hydrolase [Archangium sp.]|uniref:alpha/beta fold hydrolase n=1 Tax=Archangium sp. TaxID=1872627 RepID=UPI002D23FF76|nr:alpha/beta hydrolase [Archangium sp.]HYO59584.1 alpha/beta hydrolase [Archangium sp.]